MFCVVLYLLKVFCFILCCSGQFFIDIPTNMEFVAEMYVIGRNILSSFKNRFICLLYLPRYQHFWEGVNITNFNFKVKVINSIV